MATDLKAVAIIPLNGTNSPTWKVQCQMALVHDGLWGVVNGMETAPDKGEADRHSKFLAIWDCALATIVIVVESSLLYLIREPEDLVIVWKKYRINFRRKHGKIS